MRISLEQWIKDFNAGLFDGKELQTQINAGWYDWFCRNNSLRNKTYKMAPMIKRIAKSAKIDPSKVYVFFKNNCPMRGPLYDDFRICDMETTDVIFTITPKSGHTGLAEVWGKENDFEKAIVSGTMKEIYKYFGV